MSNFPNNFDDKFYVYRFTNKTNSKVYIGKTKDIKKRTNEHKKAIGDCPYFHKAIQKYGIDYVGEWSKK